MRVIGRVQGVGFRWSTMYRAEELGLRGWVRNRWDGSVEAWLEGPADRVQEMIEWLREGPRFSRVAGVEVSEQRPSGFGDFRVR